MERTTGGWNDDDDVIFADSSDIKSNDNDDNNSDNADIVNISGKKGDSVNGNTNSVNDVSADSYKVMRKHSVQIDVDNFRDIADQVEAELPWKMKFKSLMTVTLIHWSRKRMRKTNIYLPKHTGNIRQAGWEAGNNKSCSQTKKADVG